MISGFNLVDDGGASVFSVKAIGIDGGRMDDFKDGGLSIGVEL